jgi:hypothetical protein
LRKFLCICFVVAALASARAEAWGDLGHRVTALIAYRHLTPAARAALDAMLASDTDSLTARDFASRATWADKYRNAHRETAAWHFVDIEIDHPDLDRACYGFPQLVPGQPASEGPAQDCVVNKIDEFAAELNNPRTQSNERLLALKFLIHLVADLHQPLHAADHDDKGGNCIGLSPPHERENNLHAYWDVGAVDALGRSAESIADELDARATVAAMKQWTMGAPRDWAMESFQIAARDVYALPTRPTCRRGGAIGLSAEYRAQAERDSAAQLLKGGVRLASLLNRALQP